MAHAVSEAFALEWAKRAANLSQGAKQSSRAQLGSADWSAGARLSHPSDWRHMYCQSLVVVGTPSVGERRIQHLHVMVWWLDGGEFDVVLSAGFGQVIRILGEIFANALAHLTCAFRWCCTFLSNRRSHSHIQCTNYTSCRGPRMASTGKRAHSTTPPRYRESYLKHQGVLSRRFQTVLCAFLVEMKESVTFQGKVDTGTLVMVVSRGLSRVPTAYETRGFLALERG